jgi:hypothetical protein
VREVNTIGLDLAEEYLYKYTPRIKEAMWSFGNEYRGAMFCSSSRFSPLRESRCGGRGGNLRSLAATDDALVQGEERSASSRLHRLARTNDLITVHWWKGKARPNLKEG